MIQSIQFRTHSFLLESGWKERPWDHCEKHISQKLYDHGFDLGALQNQIDDAGLQRGNLPSDTAKAFMADLKRIQIGFDKWYQEFVSVSPSPLYWVPDRTSNPMLLENESMSDESPMPDPFMFRNLRLATVTVAYWGLKIILADTHRQLFDAIARSSQLPGSALTASKQRSLGASQQASEPGTKPYQSAYTFAEPQFYFASSEKTSSTVPQTMYPSTLSSIPDVTDPSEDPFTLAINILRAMPFCLSDEQGMLGAQQSLFPLRVALFNLRLQPGKELRWCQNFYRIMDERKGLRYAKTIANLDGGHGSCVNERREGVTPADTAPRTLKTAPYIVMQTGDT